MAGSLQAQEQVLRQAPKATQCPAHVLQAIYGSVEDKKAVYDKSLHRWWEEYASRKNDEEDEHVADSLLYDRNHLPRSAPPPQIIFQERERRKADQSYQHVLREEANKP